MSAPAHEVAVIGAGFSGIGASIGLGRKGYDHVLVEEADEVGGTWHWNRYPGVAVDIPAFSYQFSFERRTDWSRVYAPGRELLAYARDLADTYGVRERVRFGTRVESAALDDDANLWRLETSAAGDGRVTVSLRRSIMGKSGMQEILKNFVREQHGSRCKAQVRAVLLQHAGFEPARNRLRKALPFARCRRDSFRQSQADKKALFRRIGGCSIQMV